MKKLAIIGITLGLLLVLVLWQQQQIAAAKAAPMPATQPVTTSSADQSDPKSSNNTDNESTTVVVGVASITLSPTSVKGGSSTVVTGTVTLTGQARSGGQLVLLSSNSTSIANPRVKSITIPFNQTSGTFTLKHFKVSSNKSAKIKASANGFSKRGSVNSH
jgi:hypothetical protein